MVEPDPTQQIERVESFKRRYVEPLLKYMDLDAAWDKAMREHPNEINGRPFAHRAAYPPIPNGTPLMLPDDN